MLRWDDSPRDSVAPMTTLLLFQSNKDWHYRWIATSERRSGTDSIKDICKYLSVHLTPVDWEVTDNQKPSMILSQKGMVGDPVDANTESSE